MSWKLAYPSPSSERNVPDITSLLVTMNSHFELLSLSHLLQDFYIVLSVGASWLPTAQYRSTTCKQQFANQQSPSGCSCTIHHLHYQQCNTAIERMSNKSWWQRGGRFKLVWANNTGFWLVHWSLKKFRELLSHPVQKDSKHAVLERHRGKLQENFSWPLTILLELKVTGADDGLDEVLHFLRILNHIFVLLISYPKKSKSQDTRLSFCQPTFQAFQKVGSHKSSETWSGFISLLEKPNCMK